MACREQLGPPAPVLEPDDVALVAHHAAHGQAGRARSLGQPAGVRGTAAAAGESDVDVDEHLTDAGSRRGGDRLLRVDGHGHAGAGPGERAEPGGVGHLVGQEEVLAEAGVGHALHLGNGGAGEPCVPVRGLASRQRRALVRLHVGTQPVPGQGLRHGAQVGLESRRVDHEGRRRELRGLHSRQASDPPPGARRGRLGYSPPGEHTMAGRRVQPGRRLPGQGGLPARGARRLHRRH